MTTRDNASGQSQPTAVIAGSKGELLHVSVNAALVDKVPPTEKRAFSHGFEPLDLTIGDLEEVVKDFGYAFSYRFSGGIRKTENFLGADFLAVDVDNGMLISQALENPIVTKYCSLLYTTVSHTLERHRFRLVFRLPRTITDARELKAAAVSLSRRLGGDLSATDAARLFYGSRRCQTELLEHAIDEAFLESLIADGRVLAVSDSVAHHWKAVTSRSQLQINRDQLFTTAEGKKVPICEVFHKVSVYCPFHPDDNPSAFIAVGPSGRTFFRCSACQLTRYMEGAGEGSYDFNSFEKAMQAIKDRKTPEQSAEFTTFDYYSKGVIKQKLADIHFSDEQYLKLSRIEDGITLIKSPKGSGKTHYLVGALQEVLLTHGKKATLLSYIEEETDPDERYHTSKRVLLIGHRQALIRDLCQRLGLNCYLDDPVVWRTPRDGGEIAGRFISPVSEAALPRYGVCLDSLWRVKDQHYDIIIIDESEQVLSHFLSDTIGEQRYKLFEQFKELVAKATSVVALDADLGWASANTLLALWRDNPRKTKGSEHLGIYINKWKEKGAELQLYVTKGHLFEQLKASLASGERVFVASNSRSKVKALKESLSILSKKIGKQLKVLVITAENSRTAEIQKFITNIKTEILKYDAILASPSLGTGVDITFANSKREIDAVFGIFENQINSHTEIDQQLARVRHPKSVHVWVSPQTFDFETNLVVTKEDFCDGNFNAVTYAKSNQKEDEEDPFITLAATLTSFQRASKNHLRNNFCRYKTDAGWRIVEVLHDNPASVAGGKFFKLGLKVVSKEEIDAVVNAKPLSREELEELLSRWDSNHGFVTLNERYSYYRDRVEKFYGKKADEELVKLDDHGRLRDKVRRFEAISCPQHIRALTQKRGSGWKNRTVQERSETIISDQRSACILLYELFSHTPCFSGGRFKTSVVFESADLKKFTDFVLRVKNYIESHLGVAVPSDVRRKPVQMLRKLLKLVGLTHWRFRPKVIGGHKTYSYRVCPNRLAVIMEICQRRVSVASASRFSKIAFGEIGDLGPNL
jgi:hypothetical protein